MAKLSPAMTTVLPRSISSGTTALTRAYSLYTFDLIELNGDDLRRDPLEVRKAALASIVAKASPGIRFNEHLGGDGPMVFAMHASSAWKASCRSARAPPTVPAARPTGSR
jgi:hypothetical protein